MSQLMENDPAMRELERRHKLWKLEYYSGIEAARDEAKVEGKTEIARNMKRKGCDSEFISEMTGLSADEISGLK